VRMWMVLNCVRILSNGILTTDSSEPYDTIIKEVDIYDKCLWCSEGMWSCVLITHSDYMQINIKKPGKTA
jgi:hypothetical protein